MCPEPVRSWLFSQSDNLQNILHKILSDYVTIKKTNKTKIARRKYSIRQSLPIVRQSLAPVRQVIHLVAISVLTMAVGFQQPTVQTVL